MAYNPYFTFADPALQQAVVQEAQVRAAADAARQQQFAQTLAALRQERQAQADKEERRAIREGDIRRQEAAQAENQRQFNESLKYNREALGTQTELTKTRQAENDEKELYNNLLNLVEKGDVVPTLSELNARMAGLSPSRKQALIERRQARFDSALKDFNIVSDEAARMNKLIGSKDPKTGLTLSADDALNRSQHKRLLRIGPDGLIEPLLTRPREDVVPGAAATASTSFRVPPAAAPPAVENISDIQKRAASPSLIMRGGQEAGNLLYQDALRRMGQGAGEVMAQQAGGVLSRALPGAAMEPPSPGILDRAGSYLRGSVMPSVAEGLNRMQIGPDLTGYFPREQDYPVVSPPLPMPRRTANVVIDADTGDILAPPVFAPQY
jgi:hypothetical protein